MTTTNNETTETMALDAQIASLLPHELHFVQHFTKGCLVGMTYRDSMQFESAARAEEWIAGVNRNNARGQCDYRVERA